MRTAMSSIVGLLLVVGPASAQTLEIEIVQKTEAGGLLVTKTVRKNEQFTYNVQVPVTVNMLIDGKVVQQTQFVTETRVGTRVVGTKALVTLSEADAKFTDLAGKAVPLADLKKRMEKSSLAVIVVKSDDPPLSDLVLSILRENTLILQEPPVKTPPPNTPKVGPKVEPAPMP